MHQGMYNAINYVIYIQFSRLTMWFNKETALAVVS